jgi:cystathionine beta-lyase
VKKTPATSTDLKGKTRLAFLKSCSPETQKIQMPIIDPMAVKGHPNPAGLDDYNTGSLRKSWGQSSVLFPDVKAYETANKTGESPYGGAEYGVVLTPEADAVCQKFTELHNGFGAIICPSGLAAITTTIEAFAPQALVIPDNIYPPVIRYLKHKKIPFYRYPAGASAHDFEITLTNARRAHPLSKSLLVYLEAPGSGTFEIPDIEGIVAKAKEEGLKTIMDNTWASHVRFKPIEHDIDIVIQATTKYEGGYGDTPSGIVITKNESDFNTLAKELRISGNGAVCASTCERLLHRVNSTEDRMNVHARSAATLSQWFLQQSFVADVLSPALESSPYHDNFKKFFGGGNGLFSVVFHPDIPEKKVINFFENLNLFWVAESWGGHVSLVLPLHVDREHTRLPQGHVLRFHAGLESEADLFRDIEQAAQGVFSKPRSNRQIQTQITSSLSF